MSATKTQRMRFVKHRVHSLLSPTRIRQEFQSNQNRRALGPHVATESAMGLGRGLNGGHERYRQAPPEFLPLVSRAERERESRFEMVPAFTTSAPGDVM